MQGVYPDAGKLDIFHSLNHLGVYPSVLFAENVFNLVKKPLTIWWKIFTIVFPVQWQRLDK